MAYFQSQIVDLGRGSDGKARSMYLYGDYYYTDTGIYVKPNLRITGSFAKKHKAQIVVRQPGEKGLVWGEGERPKDWRDFNFLFGFTTYHSAFNYECTVVGKFAGKECSVKFTNTAKPNVPSIGVSYVNDNRLTISVSNGGKRTSRVTTVSIQRQEDIDSAQWEDIYTATINSNAAYGFTYTDQTTSRGHRYKYRAWANSSQGASGTVYSNWLYTQPPDISNVAHVRNSNTRNTVTWQHNTQDVDRGLITGYTIEKSVSGGAWAYAGRVTADARYSTVSFVDNSPTPNRYYSYRIQPYNSQRSSSNRYDTGGTDITYNTPAAVTNLKAVYTSQNYGQLTWSNPAVTATVLTIERSEDGGSSWTEIATIDESSSVATSYLDQTAMSGTSIMYRVRNGREGLPTADVYSAWAYSNTISTLRQPSAPTLTMPVNGTPIDMGNGSVDLSWVHNPNDGTPQQAAQIQYAINGTYVATISLTTEALYTLQLPSSRFSANDIVTWRVRTKGAHANWSDWSAYNNFKILTRPEIVWTSPNNGDVISNLPISLGWSYNDESGTLRSLKLEIIKGVKVLKTVSIPVGTGRSGDYSFSLKDFLFDNETDYELRVTAVSTTGLSGTDSIMIRISYVYVLFTNALFPDADFDVESGRVTLTLNKNETPVDPDEEEIVVDSPVVEAYLYRNINGERILVASELTEGEQVSDSYVPVNIPVTYELLQVAETGEISVTAVTHTFISDYWYVYWGTNNENLAKAMWDPSGEVQLTRPEKEQIRYSGRQYPVTYDSTAIDETFKFSGVVEDRNELNNFIQMIRDGGQGIWKSANGECYDADFEFSYSSNYTENHLKWDVSLDVTRIENNG